MRQFLNQHHFNTLLLFALLSFCGFMLSAQAENTESTSASKEASALLDEYKSLGKRLSNNQFKRPLVLNSTESADSLKGEIYAVVDYPFATVSGALNKPNNWCEALILHLNIKYCKADQSNAGTMIQLNLGKKYDQQLSDTYKTAFNYQEITKTARYFSIALKAKEGALGTYDYHIFVEAMPIENGQTFLHFTYSYSFGLSSRIAMKGYLATIGSGKVGFTMLDDASGKPKLIQGVRSVVERNTMRYYLAIDSFLDRKSTRLNSSHSTLSRMPSSA